MRPPFSSEQTLVVTASISPRWGSCSFSNLGFCGSSFLSGRVRLVESHPGAPVFNLGLFCLGVAWTRSPSLVTLSVATRLLVMAAIATLVATGRALPIALVVGVIDVVSAALTLWAVTSERRS